MLLSTWCSVVLETDTVEYWVLCVVLSTKARRAAGGRAAGGGRVGILIELLRILSCSGMLLSTGCCVGDGCC